MPIGPHRAAPEAHADAERGEQGRRPSHLEIALRRHPHSLCNGLYQGWDLHPAQFPTRYAAVYCFFLEGYDDAAAGCEPSWNAAPGHAHRRRLRRRRHRSGPAQLLPARRRLRRHHGGEALATGLSGGDPDALVPEDPGGATRASGASGQRGSHDRASAVRQGRVRGYHVRHGLHAEPAAARRAVLRGQRGAHLRLVQGQPRGCEEQHWPTRPLSQGLGAGWADSRAQDNDAGTACAP